MNTSIKNIFEIAGVDITHGKAKQLCETAKYSDATHQKAIIESKVYKFYDDIGDGYESFFSSTTDLKMSTPTMQRRSARTGKTIIVKTDGKKVGEITKNGFKESD